MLQREFLRVLRDAARALLRQQADAGAMRDLLGQCERIASRLVEHEGAPRAAEVVAQDESQPIDAARLQAYLRQRFSPALLQVLSCTTLPGGRSKRSLRATLAANTLLPEQIVLRQDKALSAQGTSVRDEFPVMRSLHEQGVCIAEPLWLEQADGALGAPFLAMRALGGAVPGDYWSAGKATPAIAAALARALATLHGVPAQRVWPQAAAQARDSVELMLGALQAQWQGWGGQVPQVVTRAWGALQSRLPGLTGGSVVVHGDVHFGNLLVENGRITGITDWEFAHAGHAAEDLAFCRSYVESLMPWEEFLRHYRDAGGAQLDEIALQFFRIWTSLRNLTLAARIRARLLAGGAADMQGLLIAVDALPRLESALAATLDALGAPSR